MRHGVVPHAAPHTRRSTALQRRDADASGRVVPITLSVRTVDGSSVVEGHVGDTVGTDLLVVLDTTNTTGSGDPVVDWGIPIEVPARVLATLAGDTNPDVVVVRNGVVLYAPGNLNLGRTTTHPRLVVLSVPHCGAMAHRERLRPARRLSRSCHAAVGLVTPRRDSI